MDPRHARARGNREASPSRRRRGAEVQRLAQQWPRTAEVHHVRRLVLWRNTLRGLGG